MGNRVLLRATDDLNALREVPAVACYMREFDALAREWGRCIRSVAGRRCQERGAPRHLRLRIRQRWISQAPIGVSVGFERFGTLGAPFVGYRHTKGYRMRASADDPGVPVTRLAPRSLLEQPGIPDFMTRARYVQAGTVMLRGRTWSGWGPITRIEVSVDGGRSWQDAALGDPLAAYAWRAWSFHWEATPGVYDICSRATDATGGVQSMQAPWNLGGYMNNAVQHTLVTVRAAGAE